MTALVNKQASVKNNQLNKPTQTMEIQTDLTWPNSSDRPFLLLPSKSIAEVQTDTSVHTFLGPTSGEQAAPTPPKAAHRAAGAAAGGLPPPAGAKPSSKSSTPVPSPYHCISAQESELSRSFREKQTGTCCNMPPRDTSFGLLYPGL